MENIILTQLSISEIKKIFRQELEEYFETREQSDHLSKQSNDLLTIDEVSDFLHLAKSTLYSKVSKGELPVMKRGKRLYFSKIELMEYIKEGRKKTNAEIEEEANTYVNNNK